VPPATAGRGTASPAASPAPGPDQPQWPNRAPVPPPTPLPDDDGLSPLERTEAVLPSPVPRTRRLLAAAEMLLKRPLPPEGVIAVGPGTGHATPPPPGRAGRPDEMVAQQVPDAAEPAGPLHLIPTDLTVAAAPTRTERVRAVWRDMDHLGQLDTRIAKPRLHRCATIAVVSPKGGVGKTTVVALLGTLFALLRRDPVVAVDTNPDFGSLGRVLTPDQSWYVDDLARLVAEHDELSLTALESRLGRAVHGLLVVPAPTDPVRMAALDEGAYRQVISRLKDFFSVILLDCGTGLQDPASAAAIAAADHVVLVTDAQPATASLVAESASLLLHSGRPMSVVVNRMPARGTGLDLVRLSQYIPAARGLVVVPDEIPAAARLAIGSFNWRDAPPSWQRTLRELAVVITADWQRLGLAR
jgi:MinD-like ATPase involved in chromosome partitioning or flagellar assembly